MYKKQVIVFIVSPLIAGFFVLTFLSLSPNAYAGIVITLVCCDVGGSVTCQTDDFCQEEGDILCPGSQSSPVCDTIGASCTCEAPPQIPTLDQWGKIITMVVIGLFAVIGIFAMRRRTAAS